MSIDQFFNRQYSAGDYNCAHFVSEVWRHVTGEDISQQLSGFLLPPRDRAAKVKIRRRFRRLEKPKSPCIVLMQRPGASAHVGVFILGRVFHIRREGVEFQPLEVVTLGFKTHRFYDVKKVDNC